MKDPGHLHAYLKRFAQTVRAFTGVSAALFVLGCASLAVSRVCQVIAFFLPLKIFILITSGKLPEYVDIFPEGVVFSDLIVLLCLLVPLVYLLFIVLGIGYRWMIDLHMKRFGAASLQVGEVTIKGKKVNKLHGHVSKAFSDAGLMLASVMFALLLDPVVALVWMMLLYLNLWLFHRKALHVEDHQRLTFLKLHRRQFIDYVSSANFLVVFGLLALALVYLDMGVYSAIFLLLVSRMLFQALNRFAVESLHILRHLP